MSSGRHIFRIEGMHCASCGLLVDDVLADLPGVVGTQTSVKQAQTVVQVDPGGCTPNDIIAAVREIGYVAREVT